MKIIDKNKNLTIFIVVAVSLVVFSLLLCSCSPSKFEPKKKNPTISSPDILKNGVLKVGVDYGNPPLANDASRSSGIDIDVASAIADELGLNVEFVDVGASPELSLENKKVDIVMGISKANNINEIWKSDTYLESACALFTKTGNTSIPTKNGNDKIATQMASPSALAAQAQFNVASIKLENSIEFAFDDLIKDEVKYVAADSAAGYYFAKEKNINVSMIALITKLSGYCVGVNNSNNALMQKITGAIDTLKKGGVTDAIAKRWMGKSVDYESIPLSPEANNQADAGELENGVYGQTDPNAPRTKETL